MFLARIARSFRDHDWFTGFVELVLLVAGIFIGFQLDSWNDERLDQKQADEYRLQLIADLKVEHNDVDTLIAYHTQVRAYAMTALTAWNQKPAEDAESLIVAFYQASNVLPFTAVRGAFDALSNNGLIELIGGPKLTSKLSAYYGGGLNSVFSEEKRYRMELRGVMPVALQLHIIENCIEISVDETITEELSSECSLGLTQTEAAQVLADILTYPKMRFYLRQAVSRDSVSIYLLRSKREFIESLLNDLQALNEQSGQTGDEERDPVARDFRPRLRQFQYLANISQNVQIGEDPIALNQLDPSHSDF
jgi:hypothetical protein